MKTIPEKRVLICDVCGTTDETPFRFQTRAHLTLKQDALDYQGSPCADATRRLDLCDNCASRIAGFIRDEQEVHSTIKGDFAMCEAAPLNRLEQENARLREALNKYGDHLRTCRTTVCKQPHEWTPELLAYYIVCDCGFDEACK